VQSYALDPLFESDELMELAIDAPIADIMRDDSTADYRPASLRYTNDDGEIVELEIGIRAGGNYRRRPDVCNFAPLRLNFKKSQVAETVFENQDRLKLVTHCQTNSPRYDQFVLKEYLAYRFLNLVTDLSYRARLVRITYLDAANDDRTITRLAVMVEHRDRLAKRASTEAVDIERIVFRQLEPAYTNIISMFHYLIGNTDYSPIAPSPGEDCCHNHTLFGPEGPFFFSVPFDFDMSGFVNPPHAISNPRFKLRNVLQRRYRGRCFNNAHIQTSVQKFFEQRDNINTLINSQGELMTESTRKAALRYVDGFFESLGSPGKAEKILTDNCT